MLYYLDQCKFKINESKNVFFLRLRSKKLEALCEVLPKKHNYKIQVTNNLPALWE